MGHMAGSAVSSGMRTSGRLPSSSFQSIGRSTGNLRKINRNSPRYPVFQLPFRQQSTAVPTLMTGLGCGSRPRLCSAMEKHGSKGLTDGTSSQMNRCQDRADAEMAMAAGLTWSIEFSFRLLEG
ncbi:hypothetical protein CKAH01_05418 [Colletotrichum kahawae]|uniref:Uncharacterized protein n=1 Tax=Colletotrichum kahawae TaxID=34407 RepID=A0AAE0D564_COLKA|nr:hypothetical protein CKAH01_05418 [Colletotrichum kahawae]